MQAQFKIKNFDAVQKLNPREGRPCEEQEKSSRKRQHPGGCLQRVPKKTVTPPQSDDEQENDAGGIQLHDAQDLHDASTSSKWPKIKSHFDGTMIPDYGASSESGYKEALKPFPSKFKPLDLSLGYMYPSKPMKIPQDELFGTNGCDAIKGWGEKMAEHFEMTFDQFQEAFATELVNNCCPVSWDEVQQIEKFKRPAIEWLKKPGEENFFEGPRTLSDLMAEQNSHQRKSTFKAMKNHMRKAQEAFVEAGKQLDACITLSENTFNAWLLAFTELLYRRFQCWSYMNGFGELRADINKIKSVMRDLKIKKCQIENAAKDEKNLKELLKEVASFKKIEMRRGEWDTETEEWNKKVEKMHDLAFELDGIDRKYWKAMEVVKSTKKVVDEYAVFEGVRSFDQLAPSADRLDRIPGSGYDKKYSERDSAADYE